MKKRLILAVVSILCAIGMLGIVQADGPLSLVASVDVGSNTHDVAVVANLAYVATDTGLTIVDVTTPALPGLRGSVDTAGSGHCEGVIVEIPYAYLACQHSGIYIVNVANPDAPQIVSSTTVGSNKFWDIAKKNNILYAVTFNGEMYLFDVSNPASPQQIRVIGLLAWRPPGGDVKNFAKLSDLEDSGNGIATGVSIDGNTLVTIDWRYGRIYVYDVSNAANPVFMSTHYVPVTFGAAADTDRDVIYIFVAWGSLSGIYTVPISSLSTTEPTHHETCPPCDFLPSIKMQEGGLTVADGGKYVVFAGSKVGRLIVVDVTNPSNLVEADTIDTGPPHVSLGEVVSMDTQGDYIYLGAGAQGFHVYRFPGLSGDAPPVDPTPVLAVSPTSLLFSTNVEDPEASSQSLSVANAGSGELDWTAIADTSSGGAWLSVSPAAGTAPSTLTVSVNPAGLAEGVYAGTILVEATGANNSPREIPVTLTIEGPPDPSPPAIAVNPTSFFFSANVENPESSSQSLTVANAGGETLQWTAVAETDSGGAWLSVNPTAGTAPSNLTVSINPFGLLEGEYTGTIRVTSAAATNSPQEISVILVISATPDDAGTLHVAIAAREDDGREYNGNPTKTTEKVLPVGKNNRIDLRFVNVTIPQGATIESAVLNMYGMSNLGKHISIRYLGEAAGNSAPFDADGGDLTGRPTTAAVVDDTPGGWTKDDYNASPDLRVIIQEIVNRPDWVPGNSLTLFIDNNGSSATRNVGAFESSPSPEKAVILTVTFAE